ncbi:type II secretion system F family protein [Burkholderia stagnalis]|uniref:type II secretion system F family protein n=1 Tax=Burkholderia stagnalis TaxID=1503054 RepID=UPI000F581540|nr:type II secretion system F family protein [Burkholderia stagnalis]RQQ53468.1 pilus assembly protein [Burkholderia stagnalis]RQY04709.1 pilus assembly protein [Burkholderia stagnalis]RQY21051.1 pilus assembly protein [Burkholderia stagnalis]RQY33064.1 pilus assembly protein [Burkholderia stagnalis]
MYSLAAGALALVCIAAALLLWRHGELKRDCADAQRFIDSRIEPAARAASAAHGAAAPAARAAQAAAAKAGTTPASAAPTSRRAVWRARATEYLEHLASRAGIDDARGKALLALAALAAVALVAGQSGGVLGGVAALVGGVALLTFWLVSRIQRRRLQIVRQLPSFLDGIVRLVTLGNSVPAAFQAALQTTEAPLRGCLDHVSRMLRTGVEIDRAMMHIAKVYHTKEFELVGSVLRLSVRYGGRADVMLERMAVFMRDLEQAERELMAMSSETRLSAWVLVMLPIAVGGFVISTNPSYLSSMWNDESGRTYLYLAFVMQIVGGAWLYRMARLR